VIRTLTSTIRQWRQKMMASDLLPVVVVVVVLTLQPAAKIQVGI
jgi:hypothetical protein